MSLAVLDRADVASPEERITAAALRCIARWGVAKTTLDDVAREAGCSRATIYRLFPGGKDSLVTAVAEAEVARFFAGLGARLAAAGFTVVTGGYGGLMRAAGEAAHAAGGRVVGLPMSAWRHLTPGAWNVELRWATDLPTRLGAMLRCDALVALNGGVGTLSELALAWAMAQTEPAAPDVVLLGDRWPRVVEVFRDNLVIDERDLELLRIVRSPEEAVEAIQRASRRDRRSSRARG